MAVGNTGADQEKGRIISLDSPLPAYTAIPPEKNKGHAVVCAACPLRARQVMSSTMISEDV